MSKSAGRLVLAAAIASLAFANARAEGADHNHMAPMDHHGSHTMTGAAAGVNQDVTVRETLKTMFETAEKPLAVEPVVVLDDWVIASWRQDGRGGRVLLRKVEKTWIVQVLAGDALVTPAGLKQYGLTPAEAVQMAESLAAAEKTLSPDARYAFASFVDAIVIAGDEKAGVHDHSGH